MASADEQPAGGRSGGPSGGRSGGPPVTSMPIQRQISPPL